MTNVQFFDVSLNELTTNKLMVLLEWKYTPTVEEAIMIIEKFKPNINIAVNNITEKIVDELNIHEAWEQLPINNLNGVSNSVLMTKIRELVTTITKRELIIRIMLTLSTLTNERYQSMTEIINKIEFDLYYRDWEINRKLIEEVLRISVIKEQNNVLPPLPSQVLLEKKLDVDYLIKELW